MIEPIPAERIICPQLTRRTGTSFFVDATPAFDSIFSRQWPGVATGIGEKRPQGQLNEICKLFPTIRRDR